MSEVPLEISAGPPARNAMRVPIVIGAIILGLGAIVVARMYKRPDPPTDTPARGMTVGSDSVTLTDNAPMWSVVKVEPAKASEPHWTDAVPARIVFDEARTSRLGSPLAGRVTATYVERGQTVKLGDKLFTVSSPNLAELRADLAKANVEQNTARINFDRVKALVDAGSLPAKELVTAQQEVAEANLAVQLANQKLSSLKVTGGSEAATFTMTAPRDGVVVEKTLNVGQNVDPSSSSQMAIADLSDVWVVADLFENDVGALAPGAKAKVVVAGTEFDGQVDQVSSVVDPDRHTVPIRVKLANLDGALRPNAYAQIKFFDPIAAKVSLPTSAVMSDGAQTYVYIKDKQTGAFKKRIVVAGSSNGGQMPILSGVSPGDMVVVEGAILLDNQIDLSN
ncbi:MAG TPA: efflux RND transporter periplasmic adaptor subunit [Kofleriaceae bacterium]|jgi:RND family efflux transporter MFP subunit